MLSSITKNDLQKFTSKYSLKRGVEACDVCMTAQGVIEKVFSTQCGAFTIKSFRNNLLHVTAANSILLQELKFRENQIINLIMDKIQNIRIEKIVGRIN